MSKNIKEFIVGRAFDWLAKNSTDPAPLGTAERATFWIAPFDLPTKEEMQAAVAPLLHAFAYSKISHKLEFDDLRFATLSEGGNHFTVVSSLKGILARPEHGLDQTYEDALLNFLVRLDLITTFDIPAKKKIPVRLLLDAMRDKNPVFERDLEEFLPDVVAWRSLVQRNEADEVGYVRALLAMGSTSQSIRDFQELLIQLTLSLPRDGHAWLFDQLLRAIASHRAEYLYLELYRLLEFFFPMKGLFALKQRLGFEGSVLELREHCEGSLAWNVNHNTGLRTSLSFVSGAFAATCLGKAEPEGDLEQRRFKEDAMEQIAQLRHKIAHQGFSRFSFENDALRPRIEALLIFLAEAFPAYITQTVRQQRAGVLV